MHLKLSVSVVRQQLEYKNKIKITTPKNEISNDRKFKNISNGFIFGSTMLYGRFQHVKSTSFDFIDFPLVFVTIPLLLKG